MSAPAPVAGTEAPQPAGTSAPPLQSQGAYAPPPQLLPPATSTPPPGAYAPPPNPYGTYSAAPNPLGTYTPVPPVDRPIGYTMSTPSRSSRTARFGGAAGAVVAILYVILKVFLISHVATSIGGHSNGAGGSTSTQLSQLQTAAAMLSSGFSSDKTSAAQVAELRTFDDSLRNIPLSGQADTDRTSALAADLAFEDALSGDGNIPSTQSAHIAAVNQLAHDLGGGDVLSLTSTT